VSGASSPSEPARRPRKPRKGDRLVYTGGYAPEVDSPYNPGTVVGFRNYGTKVTVLLDGPNYIDGRLTTEDLYADWPVAETRPA
jgi:hypothetical protein